MTQPDENIHYRQALDAIATVRRPYVEWHVWIDEDPQSQVSTTALISQLAVFADAHPVSVLPAAFNRGGPQLLFRQGDTKLRIYGLNKKDRPAGALSWHESDSELAGTDDIRKAIKRKKGRYDLTEPYVLALCSAKAGHVMTSSERPCFASRVARTRRTFAASGPRAKPAASAACWRAIASSRQAFMRPA